MNFQAHVKNPPWSTPRLWGEANNALAAAVVRHADDLARGFALAARIQQGFARLDGPMERLCAATCPGCADNCCRRATVWYDFRDLLFGHLNGHGPAAGQIVKVRGRACPHLGLRGCLLPRVARPFICTWYICPDQQARRRRIAAGRLDELDRWLPALKRLRREMEDAFVRAVFR